MQTTSRTPRVTTGATQATSEAVLGAQWAPGETVTRPRPFGHFSPVGAPTPPVSTPAAAPGRMAIDDAAELLSLFDPRPRSTPAPDAPGVAGRRVADGGEHLAPLVPPVISARSSYRRSVTDSVRLRPVSMTLAPARHADADRANGTLQPTAHRRRFRMTLRGRLLVVLFIAAAVAGVSALAGQDVPAGEVAVANTQLVEVHVHEGDTIRSIADQVGNGPDGAAMIATIQSANGLDVSADTALEPGSILLVPSS